MSGRPHKRSSSSGLPVVQPSGLQSTTTSSLIRQISPLIVHHRALSPSNPPSRNLVLLFAWTFSNDTQLERYRHFWSNHRGFDIVTIQTAASELFIPGSVATPNSHRLIQFLTDEFQYRQIVIHTFSIGIYSCFNFIEQFLALENELQERYANAIRGLIIDSAALTHDFHTGAANTLTQNASLRLILQKLCYCYLQIVGLLTGHVHARIGRLQEENPLKLPALMLYSKGDDIAQAHCIEELIESWRKKNIKVWQKCWPSSSHVAHFKNHFEEYSAEVDHFLVNIGLQNGEN